MLPLIRMTWTINRRLLIQFSPVLAFYLYFLVLAQMEGNRIGFAYGMIFIALLVAGIITLQGLTVPVEEFLLALPVSRAQVVRAKYLTSLLGLAAGLLLPLLTAWAAHRVAPGIPALGPDILGIAGLAALVLTFGVCVFLPFLFALGTSRGLMAFAITLLLAFTGAIGWKGLEGCKGAVLAFSNRFLEHPAFTASIITAVAAFGLASLAFSIWSYRPRGSRTGILPLVN